MTSQSGIGFIGCGNISGTYFRLLPMFKNIEIIGCADLNQEVAQNQASEFGICVMKIDDLLQDQNIDIIVNLTVPDAHFDVSRSILEAGKHVFSEKPLTLSLDDAIKLKELADSKGLLIAATPDTFLGGAHQQARYLIDSGAIGKITGGTCHIMNYGMEHWHPNPDFFYKKGGGPIFDLAPYYITNLINLIGPITRVTALSSTSNSERIITSEERYGETISVETPTTFHAVLDFDNDILVSMGASWDVWNHGHPQMELYGTEGVLQIPDPNNFSGDLHISSKDGNFELISKWDHPFNVENEEYDTGWIANYRSAGIADLVRAIFDKREARCHIQRPLHTVDVMTAIHKSAETGKAIKILSSCDRPDPLGPEEARTLMK